MFIQDPVQAAIWHCLNHYDYKSAVFLAERLCSEVETDDTIFILATTYYRSNRIYQTYWLLREKARRSPECRFLHAKCAFELKKYAEAESALSPMVFGDLKYNLDDIVKEFGEIACFVLQLIAQICIKTERNRIAIMSLRRALTINPFMWDAFATLCNLGEYPDVGNIFQITSTDIFYTSQGNLNVNTMVICGTPSNFNNIENAPPMNANIANHCCGMHSVNNSPATAAMGFSSYIGNNPPDTQFQTPLDNTSMVFIPKNNNGNNSINSSDTSHVNNAPSTNSNESNNSSSCSSVTVVSANNNVHNSSGVNALQNVTTPNNNYISNSILPSSITQLRGIMTTSVAHNTIHNNSNNCGNGSYNNSICGNQSLTHNSSIMMLNDTPGCGGGSRQTISNSTNQLNTSGNNSTDTNICTTPSCKPFKYLPTQMPGTPSFGILPINNPLSADATIAQFMNSCHLHGNNLNMPNAMNVGAGVGITATQSPQTLTEVNQEPKIVGKKLKTGHSSSTLITRKDVNAPNSSNNSTTKPAVFTQTGNITPRTPINSNTPLNIPSVNPTPHVTVRRSSRLFSHSAYSVKENNKTPGFKNKFLQSRSPPRKTKTRCSKICLNNELIDDRNAQSTNDNNGNSNKSINEKNTRKEKDRDKLDEKDCEKEKIETITSENINENNTNNNNNNNISYNNVGGNRTPSSSSSSSITLDDAKVQLNNNVNNTQTFNYCLLAMKKQSADGLMFLLRDIAEGYKEMVHFHCKTAIRYLENNVPKHHLCSSWVQSLIGVCYYELGEYESSSTVFKRIHEAEPYRLEYMDVFSSALWQLQYEVELSTLSQDLLNLDKTSPVTWCVAGNCFSLHKEHEIAIKFFKRAVQLDADFVYSYTLLGHEYVLTEELDNAMDCFRSAVVRNPRHYNAWFGIGTIYSKQEKYELAELHYLKALKVNPNNSVILVHVGAMQYYMQKKEEALLTLNMAVTIDPKNPLARFHRGTIYYSMGQYDQALRELEELKEIVPKESVVFYLIGKIHKAMGNVDLALMHFSWATDLDPKGVNNQIKDAFDTSNSNVNYYPMSDDTFQHDLDPISERSDDSAPAQEGEYESDF